MKLRTVCAAPLSIGEQSAHVQTLRSHRQGRPRHRRQQRHRPRHGARPWRKPAPTWPSGAPTRPRMPPRKQSWPRPGASAGPANATSPTRRRSRRPSPKPCAQLGRVDGCFANAGVSGRGIGIVRRDGQRGMAARAEGQSRRRLLHVPRGGAPHGRARRRRRAGRHGVAGRHRGRGPQRALRRHQGRADLDDPRAGGGVRPPRRARQRHPARLDRDRHDGQRHRQREVRRATCCRASRCAAGAPATISAASPST